MKSVCQENSFPFVLRFLGLSVVAATVLVLSIGVGRAQTTSAPHPASASWKARAKMTAEKGQLEGIKVHGHWTIEVRNPDGKLVTHREFENGLATGGAGGASLLSAFLGRMFTPGSWSVGLWGFSGVSGPLILVAEPNSASASYCSGTLTQSFAEQALPINCSTSLTISAATIIGATGLSGTTVTLSGTGTVPQNFSTIASVSSNNLACTPSDSPQTCFNDLTNGTLYQLTTRNLDGQGSDPQPVPVNSGQTISVTVAISFGSGS